MRKKRFIVGIIAVNIICIIIVAMIYMQKDISLPLYRGEQKTIKESYRTFSSLVSDKLAVPSLQSESSRRHAMFTVNELWYYFISRIEILQKQISDVTAKGLMRVMMDNLGDFRRVILSEIEKMGDADNRDIWRKNEMNKLSNLVHKRIYVLQNPQTCKFEQTLICNLTNPYGFAAGIHDVLWCFVKAYHTNRTVVLISKHWHYAPDEWNSVFHPLSPVCDKFKNTKKKSIFPGKNDAKSRSLMGALPSDIAFRLLLAHGKPLAWWYGQFLKYILRPQEGLLKNVQMVRKLDYDHPIVGIHVRRTDKIGSEASFHSIEEYMLHVDDFYKRLELVKNVNVRRVFVATDDPKVLIECKTKYPNYVFVFNSEATTVANDEKTRYGISSLVGVVTDVFLLAHSDFLVCTLSSGLCRVAYELMQTLYPDASSMVRSLDVDHHYAWILPPHRKAVYKHVPRSKKEMALKVGDMIYKKSGYDVLHEALHKRSWDGYSIGTNSRTKLSASFPTYKTVQQNPLVVDFPQYPDYNISLPPFDFDNLTDS